MISTNIKVYAGVSLLSAAVLAFSFSAQVKHVEASRAAVAAQRVAPEYIETRGLLPAYDQRVVSHYSMFGRQTFPMTNVSDIWVHAETDDWILLNGPRGTDVCPGVLGAFGAANAPAEAMTLAAARALASGFNGGPIRLKVLVPRFASAPAGLTQCAGIAYDKSTGQLRVGKKNLAYLAPLQSQLSEPAR